MAGNIYTVPGTSGYVPPGQPPDYLGMAERMVQITEAQKRQAAAQFDTMIKAIQMGLPVDTKAVYKAAKRAGIPLAKDDELKAGVESKRQSQQPASAGAGVRAVGDIASGGAPKPADVQAAGVKATAPATFTPQQQKSGLLDGWIARTIMLARQRGENEQKQQELLGKQLDLKARVMSGDKHAVGEMMQNAMIPWNLEQLAWAEGTPEQKQSLLDIAAGKETEKEKNVRVDHIAGVLISSGKAQGTDAFKIADALANRKPIPPDLEAKMPKYTLQELAAQAEIVKDGIAVGVKPSELGSFVKAAQAGGIAAALPKDIQPYAIQELNLRKQQIALEQKRLGIEDKRFQLQYGMAEAELQLKIAQADVALKKEENAEFYNNYRALVDMKRTGAAVPKEIIDKMNDDFAKRTGLTPVESRSILNYLTFGVMGRSKAYEPAVSDVTKAATGQQTQPAKSTTQSLVEGTKAIGRTVERTVRRVTSTEETE